MKTGATIREDFPSRVRGLLIGSFLGDALGGPVEFQSSEDVQALSPPLHRWKEDEFLDEPARQATRRRLTLRGYDPLRPEPEPYGHWSRHAPPGTVTDDSRLKMILVAALKKAHAEGRWPLGVEGMARGFLDWPGVALGETFTAEVQDLNRTWLKEWLFAANWVLGDRDTARARPPGRLWGGLPTCCGQMVLLPLAALYPGHPIEAYRHAHDLGFFDNGPACDLNASLVAGLAGCLSLPQVEPGDESPWGSIWQTMRATDPYGYAAVPWVERPTDHWLEYVEAVVMQAEDQPAVVFERFDDEFSEAIKWEAQVCYSLAISALLMGKGDPLVALQLSLEWGHDTDSYAQIVGAFAGARFGDEIFPSEMREVVVARAREEYDFDLEEAADWLVGIAQWRL